MVNYWWFVLNLDLLFGTKVHMMEWLACLQPSNHCLRQDTRIYCDIRKSHPSQGNSTKSVLSTDYSLGTALKYRSNYGNCGCFSFQHLPAVVAVRVSSRTWHMHKKRCHFTHVTATWSSWSLIKNCYGQMFALFSPKLQQLCGFHRNSFKKTIMRS